MNRCHAMTHLHAGLPGRRAHAGSARRVLVIGAGQVAGHDVTVVGIRDRIGGRWWASRLRPDLPVGPVAACREPDLGGQRVEALIEGARAVAEEFGREVSLVGAIRSSARWSGADARTRRPIRHAVNARHKQEYAGDRTEAPLVSRVTRRSRGGFGRGACSFRPAGVPPRTRLVFDDAATGGPTCFGTAHRACPSGRTAARLIGERGR